MTAYLRLKRFVDWDLGGTGYIRSGSWSLLIALLLVTASLPFVERPFSTVAIAAIASATVLTEAWLGFVAWRGYRIFRVSAIRGDRQYDRHTKHLLAAEYADTESSTEARRRG